MTDTVKRIVAKHAQPIVVEWRDSHTQAGIVEQDDHIDYTMRSAGFVVREDDRYLRIAQTLCEEGAGELLSIPVECVISRTYMSARESGPDL